MLTALLLIFGAAMAAYGVYAYRRGLARYALAIATWRQGVATIDRSWIERMETRGNEGATSVSYRARVDYRYAADGVDRRGDRPFLCARVDFPNERRAQAWRAGVPAGATVPIWYDPARPDDAALELNRPSLSLVIVLGGVGVAAVVLALILMVTR